MQHLGIEANHKEVVILTISIFSFYYVCFVITSVFCFFFTAPIQDQMGDNHFRATLFIISVIFYQNSAIVYMIFIHLIHLRLSLVRKLIQNLINDQKLTTEELLAKLKTIAIFIDRVGDTLDEMKICYTVKLAVYIFYFLFYTVLSIYGYISYFCNSKSSFTDLNYSGLIVSWEFYYAPFFIWIFIFSTRVKLESQAISMLSQKLLLKKSQKDSSLKIGRRLKFITMQLFHRQLLIECGVFTVDWKLLFFIIGSIFSYLLIIIQFELKDI